MSAENLIAEAKRLIAKAEKGLEKIESAEPTQLRIVVRRLELFLEQHGITEEPEEKPVEPQVESDPEVKLEPKGQSETEKHKVKQKAT